MSIDAIEGQDSQDSDDLLYNITFQSKNISIGCPQKIVILILGGVLLEVKQF